MRIYISADIEGVAGVASRDQLAPSQFEYERAREWMTAEVAAACEAAYEAGAEDVVVSDSHGNAQNILVDRLPKEVLLVRSWPRPLMMMQGIEAGPFSGVLLIGYHTGASDAHGCLAHTLTSLVQELRLNGSPMSETGISAATAGHFGVPIIMASGDDAYVAHVRELLGDIECATTKWCQGFVSTKTLTPEASALRIREAVRKAVERRDQFKPFRLDAPIELEIEFNNRLVAEVLSYLSVVERLGAHTIRFIGADMVEVSKFLSVATIVKPKI